MEKKRMIKISRYYLMFMLVACTGASIWQLCLPQIGEVFTDWGMSVGWQREISLWNIAIIVSIVIALRSDNTEMIKILVIQSVILCWLLGINHFISLLMNFSLKYLIHILGIFEVMLVGGVWGTYILFKYFIQLKGISIEHMN